ncbi:MAG: BCCT family transporter [Gammaproteobacteria bacterium]|nr:BCCT family transporter [Gammaproteobacteria bacterium]MDH5344273.1 BCCT family transporter [Gammaproteobacteria bacterium]
MNNHRIDKPAFFTSVAIIVLVCIPLAASPDTAGRVLQNIYDYIAQEFGVLYLLASVGANGFLIWLAFSRYSHAKLGQPGVEPEFDTLSWIAMLFCAGIGAGLIYWSVTEWAFYYQSPPFGAEPRSAEAAEWASTYGLFHWGFTAWAFYCLPTLAVGYPYYVRKLRHMRFSNGCNHFLSNQEIGPVARLIDFLFIMAMTGGAATSLGFSTPMIAACLAWLFGITHNFALEVAVMLLCMLLFAISVWLGLKKGIRNLSDINLVVGVCLLLFILVAGPTAFLLKTSLNSVGLLMQNIVRMNFWTDPFTDSNFVEDWTVFYWAWWIAFAPYVGMFVARISEGRTIRQVIGGMLVFGSLGCWVFYMVIGNYSLYLELEGIVDVTGIINTQNQSAAIVATLKELPLPGIVISVFALMSIIFAATTYDSASYTMASSATLDLPAGDDPARWHRVFWAFALGLLPITLLFIGGLKVMQVVLLVVSLPIMIVGVVMCVSLVRSLREDHPPTRDLS